jgi:hypothetical protein
LEEQVKEEYVKVQGRLIELVAIQKVKPLSPVELKEMEDIIVLVNYIEEDLSNSAGEVPPSKEGLKMKIPYVTPDVRLEHELRNILQMSLWRDRLLLESRQDCRSCIPAIDHAMRAEFGVTQR